jgi:divalent metal cation (Fe/Co/Zn/Cd) transporter
VVSPKIDRDASTPHWASDSKGVFFTYAIRATRIADNQTGRCDRPNHFAGLLLFTLAAYATVVSAMALLGYSEPRPSYLGVAILIAAAAIMPWLAKQKRNLSAATDSAALRAGAAQSGLCAFLSVIAIVGLAMNAIWHISWVDPVAALAVTPLILWEGKEAIQVKACACC